MKYHPEDSVKRQDELKTDLLKRVDVFKKFWDLKKFQAVSLDGDRQDDILNILDSTVILLEGGNDNDLKVGDLYLLNKLLFILILFVFHRFLTKNKRPRLRR